VFEDTKQAIHSRGRWSIRKQLRDVAEVPTLSAREQSVASDHTPVNSPSGHILHQALASSRSGKRVHCVRPTL
jgi:hypothetical protein